jgi:hypothetical protein
MYRVILCAAIAVLVATAVQPATADDTSIPRDRKSANASQSIGEKVGVNRRGGTRPHLGAPSPTMENGPQNAG